VPVISVCVHTDSVCMLSLFFTQQKTVLGFQLNLPQDRIDVTSAIFITYYQVHQIADLKFAPFSK